jgi:hypothetical protein
MLLRIEGRRCQQPAVMVCAQCSLCLRLCLCLCFSLSLRLPLLLLSLLSPDLLIGGHDRHLLTLLPLELAQALPLPLSRGQLARFAVLAVLARIGEQQAKARGLAEHAAVSHPSESVLSLLLTGSAGMVVELL